ncbi:MAG: nucleotide exchange factor GrpE [Thermoanaerobaculia bacterium]
MTDSNDPKRPPAGEEDIYVIDDTGDLQEIQDLAGYRETPVPVDETTGEAPKSDAPSLARDDDAVREEVEKLRNQYLRSRADFENFRRRAEREKADYFRYALADTLRELLPILDNFERALAAAGDAPPEFRTGVEMIHKQLADTLQRAGLQTINPLGEPFDPSYHEAIAREESSEAAPNSVIDVMQKGYLLHDRLLRPALVRVAVPPAEKEANEI